MSDMMKPYIDLIAKILETGDDSFQYFLSADKGDSVKLTARIHNVYDEFINFCCKKNPDANKHRDKFTGFF